MSAQTTFYPPLNARIPLPPWYTPLSAVLFAASPLITNRLLRHAIILPLLVGLAIGSPFFTQDNVSEDYSRGFPLLAFTLAYIDFYILSPTEGETVEFNGQQQQQREGRGGDGNVKGVGEDDCTTTLQRLKWGARMLTTTRGIGWNWQVKGVPPHPNAQLNRARFVALYLVLGAWSGACKMGCLYGIGAASEMRSRVDSAVLVYACDVVIGWCTASWAFNGLNAVYRVGAAVSVAVKLCESWEWPPLFGELSEAWSVRQMWSYVWHQFIRRAVQKPGIRLARFIGLRQGTLGSRYLQLYVAFTLSMLFHRWYIFNAVRHDVGEYRFFLAQPFAITAEDFVQWCWRRSLSEKTRHQMVPLARLAGYLWTFAWFSFSLHPFAIGLLSVGIPAADGGAPLMMSLGQQHASLCMQHN